MVHGQPAVYTEHIHKLFPAEYGVCTIFGARTGTKELVFLHANQILTPDTASAKVMRNPLNDTDTPLHTNRPSYPDPQHITRVFLPSLLQRALDQHTHISSA